MAAGSYERKQFTGGAQPTSLNATISGSPSSFTVASSGGASFPDGVVGPFVVVIDRNTATEEKILVVSRVGDQFNIGTRGYDDTSAANHDIGAVVEHVLDASTIDQANRYVNLQTTKGDTVAYDGTNPVRVPVGADGSILVSDSTVSAGLEFKTGSAIGLATISYVDTEIGNEETARINADATINANDWVVESRIANGAVTTNKIASGAVTTSRLDAIQVSTNVITSSSTLVLSNGGKVVEANLGSALTVTIPADASVPFPVGTQIAIIQTGTGQVSVAPASGVTLNSKSNNRKLTGQWAGATLIKRSTNAWVLIGDLTA